MQSFNAYISRIGVELTPLDSRESLRPTEQGTEMTPEGCTVTSGAARRFRNEGPAHGGIGQKTAPNTSSWRIPTSRSVSSSVIDESEFNTRKGSDEDIWHGGTDKEGPASILSDVRTEGNEGSSKVVLF